MSNFKTRAVSREEFEKIIATMKTGFELPDGRRVRPNVRIATALTLEANLGLRIGDIVRLRLSDIVFEGNRYHLQMVEQKTGKERNFTVPTEVYIYIQNYALDRGIKPNQKLFDLSVRAVQNHLHLTCEYLGIKGVGSHSFRRMFSQMVYENSGHDIALLKELLQHSSVAITQRYIGISSQRVEEALKKHIILPA